MQNLHPGKKKKKKKQQNKAYLEAATSAWSSNLFCDFSDSTACESV
jgi:hypothetical protein